MDLRPRQQDVTGALIFVYLCVQMWLPLSYYIVTEDKMDEALAWRMFSDQRMAQKELEMHEDKTDETLVWRKSRCCTIIATL